MNFSRLICLTSILVIMCASTDSFAQGNRGAYILLKPGAFSPTNDLEHKGFDSTFSGEIAIGSYFHPNIALEAGVGYYQTDASISGANFGEAELSVIPVTVTLKGVIPFIGAEVYAGIGPGVYFTEVDLKANDATLSKDHPSVLGGHVSVGGTIDISRTVFIGGEGKYIFTSEADVFGSEIKLDGFMTSVVLGFRF